MPDEEQPENQDPSTTPENSEQEKDDEGLLLKYDVIICGTGLVQAIVASALARAGKTVLHCDGDDMYGELDTVWTLDKLKQEEEKLQTTTGNANHATRVDDPSSIQLASQGGTTSLIFHNFKRQACMGISLGTRVQTPYGNGVVKAIPTTMNTGKMAGGNDDSFSTCCSIAVLLDQWNLKDGTSPISYYGIDSVASLDVNEPVALEDFLQQRYKIQSIASVQAQALLQNPRQSRHFALDTSPVFILAAGRAVNGMLASNVADYLEFKTVEGILWLDNSAGKGTVTTVTLSRVPCSKNDVFTTKLLSPMDKRRLMKFLQLVMDYATQLSVAEEMLREQRKEALLAADQQGREDDDVVQSLNERHLNQGRSLARPQNKAVATDELVTLQQCMQQPDASLDYYLQTQHKLSPKLREIVRYALAIETSNQATPLSRGMSQLRHHLQALGRYGTTAFLVPMYGSGELSQAFCRSAAVFGATYLLRRTPIEVTYADTENGKQVQGVVIAPETVEEGTTDESSSSSSKPKTIRCNHALVPQNALKYTAKHSQRILRRISFLAGSLAEGEQRHVLILPPGSIVDNHLHAIHGITMDESVQVAPAGSTILHLTTTIQSDDPEALTILEKAAERILTASDKTPLAEIYSATYSYALPDDEEKNFTPSGMHVCSPCGQVLTADAAFEQAERIFHQICPAQEFLGLSDELDAAIRERAVENGYQDDERLMLESALGIIGAASAETAEAVVDDSAGGNDADTALSAEGPAN